jgi:hypothetical protein
MTDAGKGRRHAALGGRLLAAGLSASAAILLTTAIAERSDGAPATTSDPGADAPIVVRVVLPDGRQPTVTVPPAPRVAAAPPAAPAQAVSRAS